MNKKIIIGSVMVFTVAAVRMLLVMQKEKNFCPNKI